MWNTCRTQQRGDFGSISQGCSCELVSAWGKALHHPNAQEREGKATLSGGLLDVVHSVESPRPAESIPSVDTDVTKGSLRTAEPCRGWAAGGQQVLRGLLTPLLLWPSFLWGKIPTLSTYSTCSPYPWKEVNKQCSPESSCGLCSQCLYEHLAALSALQNSLNMTWKYPCKHLL